VRIRRQSRPCDVHVHKTRLPPWAETTGRRREANRARPGPIPCSSPAPGNHQKECGGGHERRVKTQNWLNHASLPSEEPVFPATRLAVLVGTAIHVGTCSKLHAGGGDVVVHSRVLDSQGFSGAFFPLKMLQNKLMTKSPCAQNMRIAHTLMNARIGCNDASPG